MAFAVQAHPQQPRMCVFPAACSLLAAAALHVAAGADRLSAREAELCASARLLPIHYISLKDVMMRDAQVHGHISRFDVSAVAPLLLMVVLLLLVCLWSLPAAEEVLGGQGWGLPAAAALTHCCCSPTWPWFCMAQQHSAL